MSRANESAYPVFQNLDNREYAIGTTTVSTGLTKREYFAGLAMQGIIAQPDFPAEFKKIKSPGENSQDFVAEGAVLFADALLAELEKEK